MFRALLRKDLQLEAPIVPLGGLAPTPEQRAEAAAAINLEDETYLKKVRAG